jgi:hypothetical protein
MEGYKALVKTKRPPRGPAAPLSNGILRLIPALLLFLGDSPGAWATDSKDPIKLTFKALATYPLEAGSSPGDYAALQALDGKTVVVTGYVLPVSFVNGRTREFMLMRSQATCCFGLAPKANEFLMVVTDSADGVPAVQDTPSTFAGTLRIKPETLGGVIVQCFRIEGARPL